MVKVYKKHVEMMLVNLLWLRDNKFNARDVMEDVRAGWRKYDISKKYHNQATCNAAARATDGYDGASYSDHITELSTLLKDDYQSSVKGDGDLISQMVRILQLPYTRNILSGGVIDKLAKALLIPEEMAGLVSRLRSLELSCGMCGHGFKQGEMGSVIPEGPGQSARQVLACTKCYTPRYTACYCAGESAPINDKLTRILEKNSGKCANCMEKEKEKHKFGEKVDDKEEDKLKISGLCKYGACVNKRIAGTHYCMSHLNRENHRGDAEVVRGADVEVGGAEVNGVEPMPEGQPYPVQPAQPQDGRYPQPIDPPRWDGLDRNAVPANYRFAAEVGRAAGRQRAVRPEFRNNYGEVAAVPPGLGNVAQLAWEVAPPPPPIPERPFVRAMEDRIVFDEVDQDEFIPDLGDE